LNPTLRAGTPEDLPRLLEIARESTMAAQWSPADYQKLFAPKLVQQSCVLVAEIAGTVRGFLVARGLDGDWEIENIVVVQDFQRQGLGTALMQGFLSRAGGIAVKTVHLEVRASNIAARELYKRLGFAQIGRRKDYYSGPLEDAILLKLSF
jgi:[ribosomal protein S18]-alanine N-acetyltransferase